MADKCFCHLNGYKVKDADARQEINELRQDFGSLNERFNDFSDDSVDIQGIHILNAIGGISELTQYNGNYPLTKVDGKAFEYVSGSGYVEHDRTGASIYKYDLSSLQSENQSLYFAIVLPYSYHYDFENPFYIATDYDFEKETYGAYVVRLVDTRTTRIGNTLICGFTLPAGENKGVAINVFDGAEPKIYYSRMFKDIAQKIGNSVSLQSAEEVEF